MSRASTPPTTLVPPPNGIATAFASAHQDSHRSTSASSRGERHQVGRLGELPAEAAHHVAVGLAERVGRACVRVDGAVQPVGRIDPRRPQLHVLQRHRPLHLALAEAEVRADALRRLHDLVVRRLLVLVSPAPVLEATLGHWTDSFTAATMRAVRALLAVMGVLAALALCVLGGTLVYDAIDSLADGARHGETRTPIPGTTDVELDEGKYVVYYEVDSGTVLDADAIVIPSLDVEIRRAGDGPPLELDDYGSNLTVDSGGRAAKAAFTVGVPADGRYRISTSGEEGSGSVVLGKPLTRRVLSLVLGGAAFLAGLALGILVVAVVAGLTIRDRRQSA